MKAQPVSSGPLAAGRPVLTAPARGVLDPGPGTTSTLAVPSDAAGCATARHWTAHQLADLDLGSRDVRDDAELIVSELVSNAILYGAPPVVMELHHAAFVLEVSVTDGGGPPHLFGSLPHDPTATRGRGLAIVATLTSDWGVRTLRPGPGKTVWCRLPYTAVDG